MAARCLQPKVTLCPTSNIAISASLDPARFEIQNLSTPPFPRGIGQRPPGDCHRRPSRKTRRCATRKSCWDRRLTGSSLRCCISAPGLCDEHLSRFEVRTWRGSAGSHASTDVTAGGDDDGSGQWAISQTGMCLRPLDRKWN